MPSNIFIPDLSHLISFNRKINYITILVILLKMTTIVIGQVEEDELVTEYTIIGHSTSISSTVGGTSSTSSDENVSISEDAETEARSSADSTGSGSNMLSSSLPTDSTVARDSSSMSEGTSATGSSSTRQYIAVTQTPVISKRKGVLKAETADVQVIIIVHNNASKLFWIFPNENFGWNFRKQ